MTLSNLGCHHLIPGFLDDSKSDHLAECLKKSLNLNAQHNEAVYTLEAGAAEKTNEILAESTSFESPHF